jgi:hypothetical protein
MQYAYNTIVFKAMLRCQFLTQNGLDLPQNHLKPFKICSNKLDVVTMSYTASEARWKAF